MAKVYVSSTKVDLEAERTAVFAWLQQRGHQGVHSYVADSDTVRQSCVADVAGCDAYVLILGRRYGFVPADDNPEGCSITELEYEAALGKAAMPIVALTVVYIENASLTDLDNAAAYARVLTFRQRVGARHRPAEIKTLAELIPALDAALARQIPNQPLEHPDVRALMARMAEQALVKDERITNLEKEREAALHEKAAALRELGAVKEQLAAVMSRTLYAAEAEGATVGQRAAADALRQGDTAPAKALLRADEVAADRRAATAPDAAAAQAERRRAAELARERGVLAAQTDVQSALAAFAEAAGYDPGDPWAWLHLGDMHQVTGNLGEAGHSFDLAIERARQRSEERPDDADRQRDLGVAHNRIGDVRVAQGDLPAALTAFEVGRAIAERLAARDPANTEWQRDVSISHNKIGDVRVAQGDLPAASTAFEVGRAIAERLAARDPANTLWQRDVSISDNKIGDVHVAQGDLPAALAAFEAGRAIAERLAARDPANTQWQRDLSVSHNKIGDVRVAQGDLPAALTAFEAGRAIAERLAARDPANTQWQLDLALSCAKLGGLEAVGAPEREAHLRRGLRILDALAAAGRLPPSQDWRAWFNERLERPT